MQARAPRNRACAPGNWTCMPLVPWRMHPWFLSMRTRLVLGCARARFLGAFPLISLASFENFEHVHEPGHATGLACTLGFGCTCLLHSALFWVMLQGARTPRHALFQGYRFVLSSACAGRSERGMSLCHSPFKCTFGDGCTDSWCAYLDVHA